MVSAYSPSLRFVEQGTGDNAGTWSTVLNNGMIDLADFAIAGMTTINSTGGNVTLTASNGAADQARAAIINVIGALVADVNLIAPSVTKVYLIANNTTNAFNVTINTDTPGAAITISQSTVQLVYSDGTNFHALSTPAPALSGTAVGNIDMNNFVLDRPAIKRYKEAFTDNGTTGGAITADYNNGNCQKFTLNANSTLTIANFPAGAYAGSMTIKFVQDATGSRTMTWPASFKFPNGSSNVLTTTANAVDILNLYSDDNGTTFNCNLLKDFI